ncbi:MAG: restriction endonuclease subunit R [Bacteroidetes bacterium]|nr:MAG: restriction endonuclease subunit R [Bacteroidota bacterium]
MTMAAFLAQLCEELRDRYDLPRRQAAFIWLAPNQLHLQSLQALRRYFAETRSLRPIQFEDVVDNRLLPGDVLFLNWQSVNKSGNLYIRDNESDRTLQRYVEQAKLHDTEIIVILDEAHLFAAKGKAAGELLQTLYAKIEIDVSATPLFHSDYGHTIKRPEVVAAEMIKQGVVLNPRLDAGEQAGRHLNQVLLDEALGKRQELADAYAQLGKKINPLLLIQLPNDNQKESAYDLQIRDAVLAMLEVKGITTQNHRLAVWLSNEKTNLDGIEAPDSMVDVLLFKQAIALGWDCPRAAVLLIFRENKQETFTIQTVGRILRMPEQQHYPLPVLNYGYVYTDLSRDIIQVVRDDMDYLVQNKAYRVAHYADLGLPSAYLNTRLVRNRLSSKFRKCLYEAAEAYLGVSRDPDVTGSESPSSYNQRQLKAKMIELEVGRIEIPIPRDLQIQGEEGATQVAQKERFAKTQDELDRLFRQFARAHVGWYAKVDSAPTLEMGLKMFFEEYLMIDEYSAVKIMLYEQNKPRIIELIDQALARHDELLQQQAKLASKQVNESPWDVPSERIFNEHYQERPAEAHALQPFYEQQRASRPERTFVDFLEKNRQHLDWWYKNGDKNKEDFAVVYEDREGVTRGFYVDFVIRHKSGRVALFDTKTLDSDPEFVNKHNALHAYIQTENQRGRKLMGGIIVPKGEGVWKFCENPISSARDTMGWTLYDPANVD